MGFPTAVFFLFQQKRVLGAMLSALANILFLVKPLPAVCSTQLGGFLQQLLLGCVLPGDFVFPFLLVQLFNWDSPVRNIPSPAHLFMH